MFELRRMKRFVSPTQRGAVFSAMSRGSSKGSGRQVEKFLLNDLPVGHRVEPDLDQSHLLATRLVRDFRIKMDRELVVAVAAVGARPRTT